MAMTKVSFGDGGGIVGLGSEFVVRKGDFGSAVESWHRMGFGNWCFCRYI